MRYCAECEDPIPVRRLELMPNTKYCVECQENLGDVDRHLGIREKVGTKHLGGCEGNIIRGRKMLNKFEVWRRKQKNRYPTG